MHRWEKSFRAHVKGSGVGCKLFLLFQLIVISRLTTAVGIREHTRFCREAEQHRKAREKSLKRITVARFLLLICAVAKNSAESEIY
jgi:hypothetical protein